MSFVNLGFKVGDLVVVKDTICWMALTIVKGEICMITRIYGDDNPEIFFNCAIISADGIELDVWFAEIEKIGDE